MSLKVIISPQQQEEIDFQRRQELTNIIRIFFNFTYYLGASPFRFERDKDGIAYHCKKGCWPQRVLCAFLHILAVFRLLSEVRESLSINISEQMKNPKVYFDIFDPICSFIHKLVMLKRLWVNSQDYLYVLNVIIRRKCLPARNNWVTNPGFLYILYSFFTLKMSLCLISGYSLVVPISAWTPSWWLRRLVQQSRYVFCFSPLPRLTDAPKLENISFWEGSLAVMMLLSNFMRFVLAEFCDLCILAFVLTLWTAASSFATNINDNLIDEFNDNSAVDCGNESTDISQNTTRKPNNFKCIHKMQDPNEAWIKIYGNFQAIQNLSKVINVAVGNQVTWYLAEYLTYYSIYINSLFTTGDLFQRANRLVYVILTFFVLSLSAEICNQVEVVKSWLTERENIKSVPSDEASLVLHEIITKDIGIRGKNMFTITFSFVAAYLSLMVTFFIICVQH